jgi:hypothetical protein
MGAYEQQVEVLWVLVPDAVDGDVEVGDPPDPETLRMAG